MRLPTETKVESETSRSNSETSVNSSNSGLPREDVREEVSGEPRSSSGLVWFGLGFGLLGFQLQNKLGVSVFGCIPVFGGYRERSRRGRR